MRTFKHIIQFLFFLSLVVVGIYFGNENDEPLSIMAFGNLLDPIPVWFVVLISFSVGAAVAGIYFSFELVRLWLKVKRLKKQVPASTSITSAFKPSSSSFGGGASLGGGSSTKVGSSFSPPSYSARSSFTAGPRGKLP